METKLAELITRWNTGEGKPYKGSLIDWDAYEDDPGGLTCMCAQGQVLHAIAGWPPEKLRGTEQREADAATAKLLNISTAHAILLRHVNDKIDGAPSVVLTDPGKVLGSEWSKLFDFWWRLDRMTAEEWDAAGDAAWAAAGDAAWAAAGDAARTAARTAAGDAARAAAGDAAGDAARAAAGDAARTAARTAAWAAARAAAGAAARTAAWAAAWAAARTAAYAASEIQGAHLLRERGKPFFFLPLFGFASPGDIPARPANYGEVA